MMRQAAVSREPKTLPGGFRIRMADTHWPVRPWVQWMVTSYSCSAHRHDLLASLHATLPVIVKEVTLVVGTDDTDHFLWRPFGERRVVYLRHGLHEKLSLPEDIKWIVNKQNVLADVSSLRPKEWAAQHRAKIVLSVSVTSKVSADDETWRLVHMPGAP